jgi:hypothetical protein
MARLATPPRTIDRIIPFTAGDEMELNLVHGAQGEGQ